jgi:hypothetical protein
MITKSKTISAGTPVVMSDGWVGIVDSVIRDTIVCQQNGVPDGIRAFSIGGGFVRSFVDGLIMIVRWSDENEA